MKLKDKHRQHDGDGGKDDHVGRVEEMRAGVVQHHAPAGHGRRHAEAEKAERGFGKNGSGHADGGLDHDRLNDIRQNMARDDAQIGGSHGARGLDKFTFADGQYLGPNQARVAHPAGNREGENQVGHAGAEECDQGNGDEDSGQRHECIHDQNIQERVEPAAIKSSDGAEDHAEKQSDGDDRGGDEERDASSKNDSREDVAAQLIGAEPMAWRKAIAGGHVDGWRQDRKVQSREQRWPAQQRSPTK